MWAVLAPWTAACAIFGSIVRVDGHASILVPAPRNAIDSELPPWSNGKHPPTGSIQPYGCECTNGTALCNSGQACFWFSQGCTPGCKACNGEGSRLPNFDHCPGESLTPTINDPKYRTVNQAAVAGSKQDIWKYNPWRSPGKAPVFDPCGMAGGWHHEEFNAAEYNTTKFAKQGDLGSKVLPKRPTGVSWKKGSIVNASWHNTAEHGGGYQYRLCPASAALTEECFQKMPLKFADPTKHTVVFKNASENRQIDATLVPDSVTGTGDWMMSPVQNCGTGEKDGLTCDRCGGCCDYVVPKGTHCNSTHVPHHAADGACPVHCTHFPGIPEGGADPKYFKNQLEGLSDHTFAIQDSLQIPSDIPAGEYVLGWRWDCEATSQIWSNCADITIAEADDLVV